MPELVITSLPKRLIVTVVILSAAVLGSTRPAGVPGPALQRPEPPALVLSKAETLGYRLSQPEGGDYVSPVYC